MKKISKLLIILIPTLLTSCLPAKNKITDLTNTSTSTSSISPSTSDTTGDSDEPIIPVDPEEEDTSKIDSISLNIKELEIQVGKRSDSVIVKYVFNIPESEVTLELKEVRWQISDTNIATVDDYGRVTGNVSGTTTLTCTSVEGNKKAYAKIIVYPNGASIVKKWVKVTGNVLSVGDELLFACPEKQKLATTNDTNMYLHSVSASFEGLEVSNIGDAAQFILGEDYKNRGGYTLEVPEREDGTYLATTNTGKVSFYDTAKSSAALWDIHFDTEQNCWDIRSHTTVDGWFMYNSKEDKFTTYQSNVQIDMFTVSIYRLTSYINL